MFDALFAMAALTQSVPVWSGSLPPPESVKGNYCNVAAISAKRGARVFVRSAPRQSAPIVGVVKSGMRVFTCNEAMYWKDNRHRAWLGIAYRSGGLPCSGAVADGLDIRLSTRCKTGWVDDRWVTVISG
jgi:hypothetical protein